MSRFEKVSRFLSCFDGRFAGDLLGQGRGLLCFFIAPFVVKRWRPQSTLL